MLTHSPWLDIKELGAQGPSSILFIMLSTSSLYLHRACGGEYGSSWEVTFPFPGIHQQKH